MVPPVSWRQPSSWQPPANCSLLYGSDICSHRCAKPQGKQQQNILHLVQPYQGLCVCLRVCICKHKATVTEVSVHGTCICIPWLLDAVSVINVKKTHLLHFLFQGMMMMMLVRASRIPASSLCVSLHQSQRQLKKEKLILLLFWVFSPFSNLVLR